MRRLLALLALSFAAACSADQFVSPGADSGTDAVVADVVVPPPDGGQPDAIGADGGTVDSGPLGPQLVPGIQASVDLFGVWAASAADYWVVGTENNQGFAAHWTGSSFTKFSSVGPTPLRGVWGNANGVMAAGDKDSSGFGSAMYYNKVAWTGLAQSSILGGRNVVSVWWDEAASGEYTLQTDGNIMARSQSPFAVAIDIGGTQIPANSAPPCYAMHARYAACAGGVFAPFGSAPLVSNLGQKLRSIHVSNPTGPFFFVGGDGGLIGRYLNGAFQSYSGAPNETLEGIWSSAIGETVAVGTNGTIVALNGANATPTVVSIPSPTQKDLHAVTAAGLAVNRTFIAVGDQGTVVTYHF